MAAEMYECSVNKSHRRELSTSTFPAPNCCGNPMTKVAAASQPAPTAQAPAKPANPAAPAAQSQKPMAKGPTAKK